MGQTLIQSYFNLDLHWPVRDPFLFCAHHYDLYPPANNKLGPNASLEGRRVGMDFKVQNGFRMYHGEQVPGFPVHPHRGFETITLVEQGFVDHADSLGAAGRYSQGDVQWMTAGQGIQHSEMFPLFRQNDNNPLEIFQIWLNLPRTSKTVAPDYKMFWAEQIPCVLLNNSSIQIDIVAGDLNNTKAPAPPNASWASDPDNQVVLWVIRMSPNSTWCLPSGSPDVSRMLYFYRGSSLSVENQNLKAPTGLELAPHKEVNLVNGNSPARLLFLQGRPLNEPVAHYGPFVMNTKSEILQTVEEYQKTQFGGWPWPREDMVHSPEAGRFAQHAATTR